MNVTRLDTNATPADAANGAAPPRVILGLAKRPADIRWTVVQVMPGSLRLSSVDLLDAGVQLLCHVQEGQEIFCIGFDGRRLLMIQGSRRYLLEGPSVQAVVQHARVAAGLEYPELRVKLTPLPRQGVATKGDRAPDSTLKPTPARMAGPDDLPHGRLDHVDAWIDQLTSKAPPPVTVVVKRRRAWAAALPGGLAVAYPKPASP